MSYLLKCWQPMLELKDAQIILFIFCRAWINVFPCSLYLSRSVVFAFLRMMTVQSCVNSPVGTISTAPALISGFTSTQHAPCASTTFGKAAVAVQVKKYDCHPLDNVNQFELRACAVANVTPGLGRCKFLYPKCADRVSCVLKSLKVLSIYRYKWINSWVCICIYNQEYMK